MYTDKSTASQKLSRSDLTVNDVVVLFGVLIDTNIVLKTSIQGQNYKW